WDQTSIETRVDPSQQQSKVGTTLSRSVPVGENITATLQNGLAVTSPLPNATTHNHGWTANQSLRFNVLPTDTSMSLGANISSTDEKWLPSLSAEQKLFGGPFSVTGSVGETPSGEASESPPPASSASGDLPGGLRPLLLASGATATTIWVGGASAFEPRRVRTARGAFILRACLLRYQTNVATAYRKA